MYSTRASRHVAATPSRVYRALTGADQIARWRAPDGMESTVHELDAREGGSIRVSLTYLDEGATGKTEARTDTYRGRFVRLVQDELVVEEIAFESDDPALREPMTMTTRITPADSGCLVEMLHEGVPDAVAREDNELGMGMALDRLAALVEREPDES